MPKLIDLTLKDFLEAVAAKTPTPGGGAVAASAAASGAALGVMVARYSDPKACAEVGVELEHLMRLLGRLVDEDAEAYQRVDAALSMAKESPEQKKVRSEAMQKAFRKAAEVPLGVMGSALAALKRLPVLGREGNRNLASDLGGAVHLLSAGMQMAHLYVRVNATGLRDAEVKQGLTSKAAELMGEAARHVQETLVAMGGGGAENPGKK